jgi:hypothetical protein
MTWTLSSCGQLVCVWRISRQVIELRVESGMAGMCPIVPSGGIALARLMCPEGITSL